MRVRVPPRALVRLAARTSAVPSDRRLVVFGGLHITREQQRSGFQTDRDPEPPKARIVAKRTGEVTVRENAIDRQKDVALRSCRIEMTECGVTLAQCEQEPADGALRDVRTFRFECVQAREHATRIRGPAAARVGVAEKAGVERSRHTFGDVLIVPDRFGTAPGIEEQMAEHCVCDRVVGTQLESGLQDRDRLTAGPHLPRAPHRWLRQTDPCRP